MVLDREAILEAQDALFEIVPVPEWGGEVRVRSLTGWERDQWEASINVQQGGGKTKLNLLNIRAKLAALTCVDLAGERIFSDEDALLLGKRNAVALNRVWEAATKLSGMADESAEELAEDLGDGLVEGKPSDSRPSSDVPSMSSSEESPTGT